MVADAETSSIMLAGRTVAKLQRSRPATSDLRMILQNARGAQHGALAGGKIPRRPLNPNHPKDSRRISRVNGAGSSIIMPREMRSFHLSLDSWLASAHVVGPVWTCGSCLVDTSLTCFCSLFSCGGRELSTRAFCASRALEPPEQVGARVAFDSCSTWWLL